MTHPAAAESGAWLRAARTEIERRGSEVACVSGGGTPQAFHIHESGAFTELRAGTYVSRPAAEGIVARGLRLRIVSVVAARDGSILDAGSKTLIRRPSRPRGCHMGSSVSGWKRAASEEQDRRRSGCKRGRARRGHDRRHACAASIPTRWRFTAGTRSPTSVGASCRALARLTRSRSVSKAPRSHEGSRGR
jgi:hypothetical protein